MWQLRNNCGDPNVLACLCKEIYIYNSIYLYLTFKTIYKTQLSSFSLCSCVIYQADNKNLSLTIHYFIKCFHFWYCSRCKKSCMRHVIEKWLSTMAYKHFLIWTMWYLQMLTFLEVTVSHCLCIFRYMFVGLQTLWKQIWCKRTCSSVIWYKRKADVFS